jgi:nucleotide-binding universal stress UspA family protein
MGTQVLARLVTVGVDGSPDSRAALAWAAREAVHRHVGLRLVHAHIPPLPDPINPYPAPVYQDAVHAARVLLAAEADHVSGEYPELSVQRVLVAGAPAGVLVEESRTAGLLVLGARGRGGFTRLLTGSVATQVADHAHSPVVVVRHDVQPDGPVLVGVDGSAHSSAALGFAFDYAAAHGLPLVALYAWRALPPGNLGPVTVWHYDPDQAAQEAARLLAEQLAGWSTKYPDVPVTPRPVLSFNPAETLVDASPTASLVVVGCRGRGGFAGLLLGSVSRTLVHHAHAPLAVVHPETQLTE